MIEMNDDHLDALLRAAGQSAVPLAEPSPGLAERVRHLHRRKSRKRKLAGGAAVVLVLLGVAVCIQTVGWDKRSAVPPTNGANPGGTALRLSHPTSDGKADSLSDPETLKAELARLDAEARQRQQAVREMILANAAQVSLTRVQPENDPPDPLELLRIEREKTAFLLVDRAEQIGSRAQAAAATEYRRVVELFPNTQAAGIAKERMNNPNPGIKL